MSQTPAVWIISDIHVDLWVAHGWRLEDPVLSAYYEPGRQNVYLILGDTLNGLHRANLKSQEWLVRICDDLAEKGFVYFILGNHEFYRGVFEDTEWRFNNLLGQYARVIYHPIAFIHGDTVFIAGTNWPKMTAAQYLSNATDMPAFHTEKEDILFPMTVDDMERVGIENYDSFNHLIEKRSPHLSSVCSNLVVATHFAMVENLSQREVFDTINPYFDPPPNERFIGNCLDFIDEAGGQLLWCYGHSHINDDVESRYGGRIVTNQIGYLKEATKRGLTNPFQLKRVL